MNERGFTLIETLLVVLLVALLASYGVAAYHRQHLATKPRVARACILQAVLAEQRINVFTSPAPAFVWPQCAADMAGQYVFTRADSGGAISFTATPARADIAALKCSVISADMLGTVGATPSDGRGCRV